MKQHLTFEQWNEITDQEHAIFLKVIGELKDDRISSVGLVLPFPTIGQLIQFIDVHMLFVRGWWHLECAGDKEGWRVQAKNVEFSEYGKDELIDVLWEAVKDILNIA